MDKISEFMKLKNRYKHLSGGFLVGFCALSALNAIYAATYMAAAFIYRLP